MKIQSPPGMRDFYPDDMRLQNWLFDAWRRVSRAFGFSEYEGPIFEYLDLYTLKSGEGIVSELFTFQDRGERNFAIRPEMTPTLARMVAARANALPRPIKWFSIPRMCRAERPQRGRLREFFQWNVDILGVEDPLADAEVVAVAVAFFQEIGLTEHDVVLRVSSRPVVSAALETLGIAPQEHEPAFELIDRHDRLSPDEFAETWDAAYGDRVSSTQLTSFLAQTPMSDCLETAERAGKSGASAAEQLRLLWQRLGDLGVAAFCELDLRVVRGLAYYTGIVFEAHPRRAGGRALLGGGRYDDLTGLLGGPRVPSVGFGMGDAPVFELLRDLHKLSDVPEELDLYFIDADHQLFPQLLDMVGALRRRNFRVDFSYKRSTVTKQFKQAAARGARWAVVVGHEYAERRQVTVKNLSTGEQRAVPADALLADPDPVLGSL
jgi:histidyl-tRNA synthetase